MRTVSTTWFFAPGSTSLLALLLASSLLCAAPSAAGPVAGRVAQPVSSALPDSISVVTTPDLLAEEEEDPGSAYLAVGVTDDVSGHEIYLHVDLEDVVQDLAPDDVLQVTLDLTTLDGVASDPSQVVGGEHVLIDVDQQGADAVLRNPDFEETAFCHIPTHEEFPAQPAAPVASGPVTGAVAVASPIGEPYESAGEELIHGLVELDYSVNGGSQVAADAQVTIGVYYPALYGGGPQTALSLTDGGEGSGSAPTCVDEELELEEIVFDFEAGLGAAESLSLGSTLAAKKKWCLSWWSGNCKKKKNAQGKKVCPYKKCNVSWTRLLGIATGQLGLTVPASIVAGQSVSALASWLEKKGHAVGATGNCADVYLLGAIKIGCQCVFHVF